MKKEKGLIIAAMAFFLVSGIAACFVRQYRDGQDSGPVPVYVNQHWVLQPQTTEAPEEIPEQQPEEAPVQEAEVKQPETEQEQETGQTQPVYYAFTVRRDISALHIRITPGMDGKILGWLKPGRTGYVLEHGEEWSLVITGTKSGYVYNEYIELEEIPEEDFPAEYRN